VGTFLSFYWWNDGSFLVTSSSNQKQITVEVQSTEEFDEIMYDSLLASSSAIEKLTQSLVKAVLLLLVHGLI